MSSFVLKYRNSLGANIADPYKIRQGFSPEYGITLSGFDYISKLEVNPGSTYYLNYDGITTDIPVYVVFYDFYGQVYGTSSTVNSVTIPSGVYSIDLNVWEYDSEGSELYTHTLVITTLGNDKRFNVSIDGNTINTRTIDDLSPSEQYTNEERIQDLYNTISANHGSWLDSVEIIDGKLYLTYIYDGSVGWVAGGTNEVSFDTYKGFNGAPEDSICFSLVDSYEPYYTSRILQPNYNELKTEYEKGSDQEYYRVTLSGNIDLVHDDFDFVDALPFDTEMFLEVETSSLIDKYVGRFFKTDLKFNPDDKIVTVSTDPLDDYNVVLNGMSKEFNLIDLLPETETLSIKKRPLIQVYIAGDSVVTNILDGVYWEQEIQIDPVYDHSDLVNTYSFYNSQNLNEIPTTYASDLSTDVTGAYDDNLESVSGLYRVDEVEHPRSRFWGKYYQIVRISDDFVLYESDRQDWNHTNLSSVEFTGVNGETGSFYFSNYRIYTRYSTDMYVVRGVDAYDVPAEDIVTNNSNYRYVVGYDMGTIFEFREEFLTVPTKFGKSPSDIGDNSDLYYQEYILPSTSGDRKPIPISSSNWRTYSIWYVPNYTIQYTEYIDGEQYDFRDGHSLASVIQVLLTAIGANVSFSNDVDHSEFLYSDACPLGGFEYLGTYTISGNPTYVGNLDYFITPKSNIVNSSYDDPSNKATTTLFTILEMLKNTMQLYWHIEGGRLRIEHIRWYNNGGSYLSTQVGADLTQIMNIKNGKSWGFAQNSYEFDKESMPQRYEFGWMDDVSFIFDGYSIDIVSNYVEEGKTEDFNVGSFTSDIDFIQANPSEISKDGFALIGAVNTDDGYLVPYVRLEVGRYQYMMQNGFMAFPYLHEKYHVYNLPADDVIINEEEVNLSNNVTRYKKQTIDFPIFEKINPYKLVKTALGDGKIDKLTIEIESFLGTAEIKHDTE